MQRRTSATSQMTLRQRSALTSTPWTKRAAGAVPPPLALIDVGDVALTEADGPAGQHCRAARVGCGLSVFVVGSCVSLYIPTVCL